MSNDLKANLDLRKKKKKKFSFSQNTAIKSLQILHKDEHLQLPSKPSLGIELAHRSLMKNYVVHVSGRSNFGLKLL